MPHDAVGEEIAREIALDIVVAWAAHASEVVDQSSRQNGESMGRYLGQVYKEVLKAVMEGQTAFESFRS